MKVKKSEDKKISFTILKKEIKLVMKDIEIFNDRLYYKSRLFILGFDELKLHFLKKYHDSLLQNHSKYKYMYIKLLKNYY
jgi:vesicle coat complex subunit